MADGGVERASKSHWRRWVPLALVVCGFVAFFAFGLDDYLDWEVLRQHHAELANIVAEHAVLAALVFSIVYVLVVLLSLPGGAIMTIAGGFLFGTVVTTTCVVVSATIGATLLFLVAKTALGDPLRARAGPFMQRMEKGFQTNALNYLLILRLIPLFPFWLVNLAPAFLGVPLRVYVLATFFGIIPGTAVYAWVGSGIGQLLMAGGEPDLGVIFEPQVFGPLVALAALSALPIIYRRWRRRMAGTGHG